MSFSNGKPIKRIHFQTFLERLRFGRKVVFEILPVITAFVLCSESPARVVTTVNHAILAAWISCDTIDHAVFAPIHLIEHFLVARVMAVGHQVTRRFPSPDVPRGNGPWSAGQFTFSSKEFLINCSANERETLTPLKNFRELFSRHRTGEEKVFRLFAKPFDHVLFRRIVFVT